VDFDYKTQLISAASNPKEGTQGFTVADMRQALALTEKLEATNGVAELEEDEWQFLKARVEAQKWLVASQVILDFVAAVTGAEKVEDKKDEDAKDD